MNKSTIKIYLMYWLNEDISQQEVEDIIHFNKRDEYDIRISKNGDKCLKFKELSSNTRVLSDILDVFVKKFSPIICSLNKLTESVDGFYVIEIVSKMDKNVLPSLNFGSNFLNFINSLKKLKEIDIDQYN